MRYGSVCSGIEAATVAWHPLGWEPAFFSDIEAYPRAALRHHYPQVPLHGRDRHKGESMEDYAAAAGFQTIQGNEYGAIDLLVGGTPCQDFSIAGLRAGLDGDRGNLTLEYGRLAARKRPRWLLWENVPGVLSNNDGRDFANILGFFSGRSITPPADGWRNSGIVEGYRNAYGLAWRVLDAQYVRVDGYHRAVPQRRRRVFIVGYLGDWRRAAAVLFERESLRGDPAPRRQPGQGVAPTISARTEGGGGLGTDFDLDGGLLAFGGNDRSGPISVATARNAHSGPHGRLDFDSETFVVAGALCKDSFSGGAGGRPEGAAASRYLPIAFDCKAGGQTSFAIGEVPGALRGEGFGGGHAAIAIQERAICENPNAGPDGTGVRDDGAAFTLEARNVPQAVAYDLRGREGGAQFEGPHDTANIRAASGGSSKSYIAQSWAVRRLTPVECERLQGFPDSYTDIPWRRKSWTPDGPRYKALGNSMAVNVMRWIGRRIEMVDRLELGRIAA